MAEVIGLVASVAQLVTLAAEITKLSYGYFVDVRKAPRTQRAYLQEVSALTDVLLRLDDALQDIEALPNIDARPASLSKAIVFECKNALEAQKVALEKHISSFLWPFKDKDLRNCIDELHRFRGILSDYTLANISVVSAATLDTSNALKEDHERAKVLEWLRPRDGESKPLPSALLGTGTWFLNHKHFREWRNGSPSVLWCHGPPGVGKSLLASIAVEELRKTTVIAKVHVIHYFCDFDTRKQQTDLAILQSVLHQIINHGDMEATRRVAKLRNGNRSEPSTQDLTNVIIQICRKRTTFLVIDALDELVGFKETLKRIRQFVDAGCKVLLTSRTHPDITEAFSTAPQINIQSDTEDIHRYVEHRFAESDFADNVGKGHTLVEAVSQKSNGIFLLVKLILDRLLELPTIKKMRVTLKEMPADLEQAYESSVRRIEAQSKSQREMAFRLIEWITHADRPLRRDEIIHAFAVEPGASEIDEEDLTPWPLLIRACAGLVILDAKRLTMGMVHTTASEFFHQRSSSHAVRRDIALTSITYLSIDCLKIGECIDVEDLKKRYMELPFLDYASRHWGKQIASFDLERGLNVAITTLLNDPGLRSSSFQALQYRPQIKDHELSKAVFESLPKAQTMLHVAAFWGLQLKVQELANAGNVNETDSQQWTPLHWATSGDHTETTKLLLEAGADINCRDSQRWTPLFWAAFRGNVTSLQLLLRRGADHLAKDVHGWTALHWAVSMNREASVSTLLKHHEEYNPQIKNFSTSSNANNQVCDISTRTDKQTPLDLALKAKNTDLFETLLRNSPRNPQDVFNPSWQGGTFDPPMSNMWRILNKAEAINGRESYLCGTRSYRGEGEYWKIKMLHAAIRDSKLPVMKLLIEMGADVNGTITKTALHLATFRKDPAFVRTLLDCDADISARDEHDQTALHQAVLNGFEEVISALIQGGSDVNSKRNKKTKNMFSRFERYRDPDWDPSKSRQLTTLMLACGYYVSDGNAPKNQARIASLLISHGADVTERDDQGMTALHHASYSENVELVQMLVAHSDDLNVQDNNGMTAAHYAAATGSLEIVRVLDQAGANMTVPNNNGLPPVYLAIQRNHMAVVNSLVDQGCGLDHQDKDGITPLHRAARTGNLEMIKFIVQHGAKTQLMDRFGRGAIHHLAACNEADRSFEDLKDVVDLLYAADNPACIDGLYPDTAETEGRSRFRPEETTRSHNALSKAIQEGNYKLFQIMHSYSNSLPNEVSHLLKRTIEDIQPVAFRFLIEHGAALDNIKDKRGSLNLRFFSSESEINVTDLCSLLQQLLSLGWNINEPGYYEQTLMAAAAIKSDSELIAQTLLKCGAGPYDKYSGSDAFFHALTYGRLAFLRGLLKNVPKDPLSGHWSQTLEWTACERDADLLEGIKRAVSLSQEEEPPILVTTVKDYRHDLANVFIHAGISTGIKDNRGWTALHYAILHNELSLTERLLEAGADPTDEVNQYTDSHGKPSGLYAGDDWTGQPLHIAVLVGNVKIVAMLLERDIDVNASTGRNISYYPLHGPTALRMALGTGTSYGLSDNLGADRLEIARLLLAKGADTAGVGDHLNVTDLAKFRGFEDVWEKVRLGLTANNEDEKVVDND